MATNTVTTEQVHEAIEQFAAMVAAASVSPQTVAGILEMLRNLNDQEQEKITEIANAFIQQIARIGIREEYSSSDIKEIRVETDEGGLVGKINSEGADFSNIKKEGVEVAKITDIPNVPTLDTNIGAHPSNSHTPSTKAVKDYVDDALDDLPFSEESTPTAVEEMEFVNEAETQAFAKIGSYGMKSLAYLDMQGNSVIPAKDNAIGDTPSQSNVPTSKAVAEYVEAHGGGNFPISIENIIDRGDSIIIKTDQGQVVLEVNNNELRVKKITDLEGNSIVGDSLNDYYAAIFRKWGFIGDSLASGTLEYYDENNVEQATADYSRSWGADLCRIIGAEGYCFATPGQVTKGWVNDRSYIANRTWSYAQQTENLKEVYTIALGLNDMYYRTREDEYYHYGALVDGEGNPTQVYSDELVLANIDFNDYTNNAESFCGYYAGIIQRIRSVNPKCFFFCITMFDNPNGVYNQIIRKISTLFDKVYLIDPVADGITVQGWYQGGHLSALGYERAAKYNLNLINKVIAAHPSEFKGVEFILSHPEYTPE